MRLLGTAIRDLDRLAEWFLFDVLFSRRWRAWTMVGLGVVILAWSLAGHWAAPTLTMTDSMSDGERLLIGRPWIDRRPQSLKDPFCIYVFDARRFDRQHLLGVYIHGNSLKHTFEFFGYQARDGVVKFWFPNDDTKFESPFTVVRERNGRYELKLELKADPRHDGRPYIYWGRFDGDLQAPRIDDRIEEILSPAIEP